MEDMNKIKELTNIPSTSELLSLTTEIVASHVGNNEVDTVSIPELIQSIYATLAMVGTNHSKTFMRPEPAVPIKKSIFPDYIVCLEDGKKLKMLKRHIKTSYNLTPEQYRERWGLTHDYPMVAPNYAKHRSTLAVQIGLGTKSKRKASVAKAA